MVVDGLVGFFCVLVVFVFVQFRKIVGFGVCVDVVYGYVGYVIGCFVGEFVVGVEVVVVGVVGQVGNSYGGECELVIYWCVFL